MQGIKYHSPKRHKKSLKHARLLVLQRFYFLRTVKDGIVTDGESAQYCRWELGTMEYLLEEERFGGIEDA